MYYSKKKKKNSNVDKCQGENSPSCKRAMAKLTFTFNCKNHRLVLKCSNMIYYQIHTK